MDSISDVVANGMCIGCGLCSAVTNGRVSMTMSPAGGLRPSPVEFAADEEAALLAACPGNVVVARQEPGAAIDDIWGAHRSMAMAWSGEPDVRYKAATGGVLSGLARHLVSSNQVAFVLHAAADPEAPMRSTWTISETADDVLKAAGSRYGPVAVLEGLLIALERDEPFAIVAKPCDLNAVHGFASVDERVDRLVTHRMAMVCGGTSRLTKSLAVLDEIGIDETAVSLFRYRGHGNPGATRVEAHDGRVHERSYLEMWADEGGWDLETRCKFCPDPLGEAADIAAADAWPGGAPVGEDEGFNAVVVRSATGEKLLHDAVATGHIEVGESITPRTFDDLQPHQVRKKHALAARLAGLREAGLPVLDTTNLRVVELGANLSTEAYEHELNGARTRAESGRFSE